MPKRPTVYMDDETYQYLTDNYPSIAEGVREATSALREKRGDQAPERPG